MRLLQFIDKKGQAAVGWVRDENVFVLENVSSVYELFVNIFDDNKEVEDAIWKMVSDKTEDYEALFLENRVLLPVNHPDPYHTWITGTGLTHLGSAASRDNMHKKISQQSDENLSDSMKIFKMGLENGKKKGNTPASQPEWFYKGNGLIAVPPGAPLTAPQFAWDGGEEPEIAGLYIIDLIGTPRRIGFCLGNEFSDHKMESVNYLYLAHSKLRKCSYGPEILIGDLPKNISGRSRIIRNENIIWEKEFLTGEDNMSHNIANLEHHHFKYDLFRQPGDLHIHFFGTAVLSFSDNMELKDGDIFEIKADLFGKPLKNNLVKL
jgi:hypothetical protein